MRGGEGRREEEVAREEEEVTGEEKYGGGEKGRWSGGEEEMECRRGGMKR